MVFQNVYLFHDTIRANILFGKPDATEEEMIKAAKKARCHDFIMALPDGYDTVVGEGGGTLSGGEKQRISIARAILKNAPIIILDEATASIGPENEHLIQQAISELTRGKTIITIAHRLATVQNADQILVVADGRIAEHGTHAELVQQDGLYRRFTAIREQAEGWRKTGRSPSTEISLFPFPIDSDFPAAYNGRYIIFPARDACDEKLVCLPVSWHLPAAPTFLSFY